MRCSRDLVARSKCFGYVSHASLPVWLVFISLQMTDAALSSIVMLPVVPHKCCAVPKFALIENIELIELCIRTSQCSNNKESLSLFKACKANVESSMSGLQSPSIQSPSVQSPSILQHLLSMLREWKFAVLEKAVAYNACSSCEIAILIVSQTINTRFKICSCKGSSLDTIFKWLSLFVKLTLSEMV